MPSKVIIIVIEFMFLGINIFWALLRAHFSPRLVARAKMSLSRAQNIFMPANINSIVILKLSPCSTFSSGEHYKEYNDAITYYYNVSLFTLWFYPKSTGFFYVLKTLFQTVQKSKFRQDFWHWHSHRVIPRKNQMVESIK